MHRFATLALAGVLVTASAKPAAAIFDTIDGQFKARVCCQTPAGCEPCNTTETHYLWMRNDTRAETKCVAVDSDGIATIFWGAQISGGIAPGDQFTLAYNRLCNLSNAIQTWTVTFQGGNGPQWTVAAPSPACMPATFDPHLNGYVLAVCAQTPILFRTEDTVDGYLFSRCEAGDCSASANATDDTKLLGRKICTRFCGNDPYEIHRIYDRFNTNAVPSSAEIQSVTYELYVTGSASPINAGGTPLWRLWVDVDCIDHTLDTGDWGACSGGTRVDFRPTGSGYQGISIPPSAFRRTSRLDIEVKDHSGYEEDEATLWSISSGEGVRTPLLRVEYTVGAGPLQSAVFQSTGPEEASWGRVKARYSD